ncbi:MAG: prolipoprotein diacylglyceryl transferase [Dehalococcoidia bacterium]
MFEVRGFLLTWHGFFTFVAVAVAVYLVARWARREREPIPSEVIYSVAVWVIIGGIIGARLVHVIDRWDFYGQNLGQIFAIWSGGIAIYGALLGGFAGGALYATLRQQDVGVSVGRLADLAAPAVVIAMFIGRFGDIINGEHIAKPTSMPWGFTYSHPLSPTNQVYGLRATHPAVVYEMLWDLVVLGALFYLRNRLRPYGMTFVAFLAIYSVGRFFIQFLREDKIWLAGLTEAHLIALIVLAVTVPLLAYKAQWLKAPAAVPVGKAKASSKS